MNDSCPVEWLEAANRADAADKAEFDASFGFADAVDEDAIEALSDEQVDQVLAILSKLD